jgi:hypothetical protein
MTFGAVPESITFGFKILEIPSLDEMGIPMAGLGLCELADGLQTYVSDPASCWIKRGAPVVSYLFRFYESETKSWLSFLAEERMLDCKFDIRSPVSGLLLMNRDEATVSGIPGSRLQYEWCNERRLPVMLVPNDEPLADAHNFSEYDRIARVVEHNFDMLPYRDHSASSPNRLRDWLAGPGAEFAEQYEEKKRALQGRERNAFREHRIREISEKDYELIRNIQDLRSKDAGLRDKLVHIARKLSVSI